MYSLSFTRDWLGRSTARTETIDADGSSPGGSTAITWGYTYDSPGQLIEATRNGVPYEQYGYVVNDPVNLTEPDGTNPIAIGIGLALGAYALGQSYNAARSADTYAQQAREVNELAERRQAMADDAVAWNARRPAQELQLATGKRSLDLVQNVPGTSNQLPGGTGATLTKEAEDRYNNLPKKKQLANSNESVYASRDARQLRCNT